jgi:hypothetical protein
VTFTPTSQSVTINGADQTANFTATAQTWNISGTVTATGSSATINLTGASTAATTADASGNFSFTGLANGTYTVTPTKPGVAFTPTSQSVTVNGGDQTANFTASVLPIMNTGFAAPTANAPVANTGDGNGFETAPANAYVTDGAVAQDANSGRNTNTSCTNTGKDRHLFYNYNLNIPTGALVKGIEVRLDARVSGGTATKMCVQLSWNNGANWTAAQSTSALTTTTATYTLGGPANTWGRSWALTNFSNAAFRVRIANVAGSTARTFSLDGVAVQVTYQ